MAKKQSKKTTGTRKTTKTTKKKATTAVKKKSAAKTAATATATARKSTKKTTKKTAKKATRSAAAMTPSSNGHIHGNGSVHASDDGHLHRGPLTDDELRAVKTGLTKKDLEHFRAVLLEKRAEIFGDVQGMQEARNSATGGDVSHMPLHMADVGSDNYEQEFTLGLMESERRVIIEIDDALNRIQKGTYGVCIESGKPIPRARLEIKPWAKYTIEVARERERRGLL